jgi:hypothetical protein
MDPIVQNIILNFSSELDKFKSKNADSKISQYLASMNVKNPTILKGFKDQIVIASSANKLGSGPAVVQYENKTVYVGDLTEGKKNGKGVRSYVGNGLAYVGEYHNDVKSGKGKLFDFKLGKFVFDGQWAQDKRNGYGELSKDTVSYKGNYVNDKMEGKGAQIWTNGDNYDGEFRDDVRNGKGRMTFATGDSYDGSFLNGKMHGRGVYTWKNGEKYIGEFKNGVMEGEGKVDYGINVIAQGNFEPQSTRFVNFGLTGEFGKY